MSKISDAIKKAREIHLLVELDFDGLIKRYSHYDVAVPCVTGTAKLFEAKILNDLSIGSSFDIRNMKYSTQNVSIRLANDIRLQDEEKRRRLDGGTGRIYIWCEGLDWTDIEYDGLIFQGTFAKNQHDNLQYSFTLKEESKSKFKTLPGVTINESTWPNMRTAGGGGSVAGGSAPLIFGSFAKGIPLFCVDTAAFKYLVCSGAAKSTEAEYNAGTYDVHDKDGGVIAPASYTVYKSVDGEGNLVTYFDFTGDQASLEPLSCSIQGLYDGSGEITGTEDALIEHLADIYCYLLKYHSGIDNIDIKSIRTMRSLLAGLKLSTIINSTVSGDSMVDRILSQCQCARIVRPGGRMGVMTFDTEGIAQKQIKRDIDMIGESVVIKSTPDEAVVNDLEVHYDYNPSTRKYESKLTKNHINNKICKKSYQQYGARPLKILRLPDIGTEMAAEYIASRYLAIYAFRHNLVLFSVLYHDGFDIQEGDSGLITTIEGPSWDGNGYIDEKAILLDRKFTKNRIAQTWWVVDTG